MKEYFKASFESRVGDIILVQTNSIKSDMNRIGQNILRIFNKPSSLFKRATYSHAILVIGQNISLQSLKKNHQGLFDNEKAGVHLYYKLWHLGINTIKYRVFKVVRNLDFSKDKKASAILQTEAVELFHKPYKKWISFDINNISPEKRYDNLYCSELVAFLFEKAGYKISSKPPFKTLPFDIEVATNQAPWIDVTDSYKEIFNAISSCSEEPSIEKVISGSYGLKTNIIEAKRHNEYIDEIHNQKIKDINKRLSQLKKKHEL